MKKFIKKQSWRWMMSRVMILILFVSFVGTNAFAQTPAKSEALPGSSNPQGTPAAAGQKSPALETPAANAPASSTSSSMVDPDERDDKCGLGM